MNKSYHLKILLREIEKRKEKNSRYSHRGFANFLGIAPSTLSRIMADGQEMSVAATKKIMKKLSLPEEEKLLFIASVAEEKKIKTLQTLARQSGNVSRDFKFTLESIANIAMKQFCDGCIIHFKNHKDESIVHAKHKAGHFEGGNFNIMSAPMICHPILSPDCPVFINLNDKHHGILSHLNANSLLCLPVMFREKKCGAITFLRSDSKKEFCDKDLEHAQELSSKSAYVYELLAET